MGNIMFVSIASFCQLISEIGKLRCLSLRNKDGISETSEFSGF